MSALVPVQQNGLIYFPKGTSIEQVIAALPKAGAGEIGKAVVVLFSGLKAAEGTNLQASATSEVYRSVMAGYPAYAIEAAVQAFIRGEVDGVSPTFVPSTAELHREIKRQLWLRIRTQKAGDGEPERVVPAKHFSKRWQELRKRIGAQAVAAVRERAEQPEVLGMDPGREVKPDITRYDTVDTSNGDALLSALNKKDKKGNQNDGR